MLLKALEKYERSVKKRTRNLDTGSSANGMLEKVFFLNVFCNEF